MLFRFVTLFNLQGARRYTSAGFHFTTSFSLCQVLFQSFEKTFSKHCHPQLTLCFCVVRSLAATYLSYHIVFALSRTFFKFFENLFALESSSSVVRSVGAQGFWPVAQALAYTIKISFICQHLFSFFQGFFRVFLTPSITVLNMLSHSIQDTRYAILVFISFDSSLTRQSIPIKRLGSGSLSIPIYHLYILYKAGSTTPIGQPG